MVSNIGGGNSKMQGDTVNVLRTRQKKCSNIDTFWNFSELRAHIHTLNKKVLPGIKICCVKKAFTLA